MTDYNFAGDFKNKYTFEKRLEESKKVKTKYPSRLPVIVEQEKSDKLPLLDKRKYLVPNDMTVGQFMFIIRKRINLDPQTALYIFFNNKLAPTQELIASIYRYNSDKDGFLYAVVGAEKTFG